MGINAVKGVAIGDGFAVVQQRGTEHRDEMSAKGFLSNHAGGVLGGLSSGQDIIARLALKPTSSLTTPAERWMFTAMRPRWSPRAATIPALASAPPPSPRP